MKPAALTLTPQWAFQTLSTPLLLGCRVFRDKTVSVALFGVVRKG